MLKPNPIIERAVRIHAISVLSAAIIVRWIARSVRSSARTVPLSLGAVSARLIELFLRRPGHVPSPKVGFRDQELNGDRTGTNRFSEAFKRASPGRPRARPV